MIKMSTLFYLMISISLLPINNFANENAVQTYRLDELINIAKTQSPDLAGPVQQVEQAKVALKQAKAQYKPRLGLNLSYGINVDDNLDISSGDITGGIFINYDIFGNVYRRANVERAKLNYEISQYQLNYAIQKMVGNIIRYYFDILKSEQQLFISAKTEEMVKKNYRQTEIRFESGLTDKLNLDAAALTVKEANAGREVIEHGLKQSNSDLLRIIGLPMDLSIHLEPEPMNIGPPGNLESCIEYGLENRLDLKISQQSIKMAELSLKYAKLGKLPRLNLFTTGNLPIESSSDANFIITPNLYWQFYDAGDAKFQIEYAENNLLSARTTYQILKGKVAQDIQKSYNAWLESQRLIEISQERLKLAGEQFRKGEIQNQAGELSEFEYQRLKQDYERTNSQMKLSEFDRNISHIILKESMGTNLMDMEL